MSKGIEPDRAVFIDPIKSNNFSVREKTVTKQERFRPVIEHLVTVLEQIPSDLRPPAIKEIKDIRPAIESEKLFAVLMPNQFAEYGKRVSRELGLSSFPYQSYYYDVRSGQMVISAPIPGEPIQHVFNSVAEGLAMLQIERVYRPSLKTLSDICGDSDGKNGVIQMHLDAIGIELKDIAFVANGFLHYKINGSHEKYDIGGGSLLHELFVSSYSTYLQFVDYCIENGVDWRQDKKAALKSFADSVEFKRHAIPEGLHLFGVINYAMQKENGLEDVLREFKEIMNCRTRGAGEQLATVVEQNREVYTSFALNLRTRDFIMQTLFERTDLSPNFAAVFSQAAINDDFVGMLNLTKMALESVHGQPQSPQYYGSYPTRFVENNSQNVMGEHPRGKLLKIMSSVEYLGIHSKRKAEEMLAGVFWQL